MADSLNRDPKRWLLQNNLSGHKTEQLCQSNRDEFAAEPTNPGIIRTALSVCGIWYTPVMQLCPCALKICWINPVCFWGRGLWGMEGVGQKDNRPIVHE
jgi:hypothetical protein